ncbi:MAG: hypothetical protein WCT14_18350 [Treponemataceae bacterium]
MKKQYRYFFISVAVCLFSACSSSPKAPDAVFLVRNEATKLVGLGSKAAREGNAGESVRFYEEAYRLATSVADEEGRIAALDGLASLRMRTEVSVSGAVVPAVASDPSSTAAQIDWAYPPTSAAGCIALAKTVAADSGKADLIAFASISEAEAALRTGAEADKRRASELALAASAALGRRPADRSRALRVLAEAKKELGDPKGALEALADAAASDKGLKRFAEYASARYLSASIHSKSGDYAAATVALLDALEADRRAENPAGIGFDFRALGIVAEKTGDKAAAARYYARSRDVFSAARFRTDADDAEKRRAALE